MPVDGPDAVNRGRWVVDWAMMMEHRNVEAIDQDWEIE